MFKVARTNKITFVNTRFETPVASETVNFLKSLQIIIHYMYIVEKEFCVVSNKYKSPPSRLRSRLSERGSAIREHRLFIIE